MEVSIQIKYGNPQQPEVIPPLQVYNVARILDSYILIRNGLNLMQSDNIQSEINLWNEFTERNFYLYYYPIHPENIMSSLYRIGFDTLHNRQVVEFYPLLSHLLIETHRSKNPLELVSINNGSLKTVVKDFLGWIGETFAKIVQEPNNLPGILEETAEISNLDGEAKAIVTGYVAVGAAILKNTYERQEVTEVETEIIDGKGKGLEASYS